MNNPDDISANTMDDAIDNAPAADTDAPEGTEVASADEFGATNGPAYVREPARHVSQPPVDDMQADEAIESSYTYETGYTLQKRGLGGRGAYRRAQSQQNKIRQELKYGQYLSVPKGSREIFSSREDERKKKIAIAAVLVIAIVVILLIVFWPK